MRKIKIEKDLIKQLSGWKLSLRNKRNLPYELIKWLRSNNLSVCQAKDLLVVTEMIIDEAWHTEKNKIKV